MSTPAEIIAARVNGTYVAEEPKPVKKSKEPVSKENAFPVLGGRQSSPSAGGNTTLWGPGVNGNGNGNGQAKPAASVLKPRPSASSKSSFKNSSVQEAFSLDADDQLNVARAEFIKILTAIKTETKASIECTSSQYTKKRTFLITGAPDAVKLAKRLVIKKLTKPVVVNFAIPAKVRSRVIGAQGRTLKPIILEFQVKVDIANEEELPSPEPEDADDIFAKTVPVTIEGDAEGCKGAKAAILAIVKEETKNMSVKIAVSDFVKPFVAKAAEPVESKYSQLEFSFPAWDSPSTNVIISGDREAALEARDELKDLLASLEARLTVHSVPIPQVKHQFLPIKQIIEEDDVFIKLPEEGETDVKFIGEKKKIAAAQEKARQTTSQYKVDVLDMSKAHKGNLPHVRAVAALLRKNGYFRKIAAAQNVVITPPKFDFLADESNTSIPIEITVNAAEPDVASQTRKAIVATVNKFSPEKSKVIDDIDSFLVQEAPAILDISAPANKADYVVLGNRIVLFDVSETEESDDFDVDVSSADSLLEVNKSLDKLRAKQDSLSSTVLSVDSKKQNAIAGENKAVLKSLIAELPVNAVEVELHNDGTQSSENSIYIHGLKEYVEKIKDSINGLVRDFEEHGKKYTSSVELPAFVLPRIVGRGGSAIQALRREYDINIEQNEKTESVTDKSVKTTLHLVGQKRSVEAAKEILLKSAKKHADETVARVRVEQQYHKRIAGPRFVYMNRLQDKYSVVIRFPSEKTDFLSQKYDDTPSNKDEITIKGPSRGVAKAEEEIKELLNFEKENGHKESIKIPSKALARVIGKGGETIRDITEGFGVEYHFNRDKAAEEEQGYAEVEFTGSRTALKDTIKRVKEIIEEVENFVTITINVPAKYHRDLIGPSGSVMREIISKAGGEDVARQKYIHLLRVPDEGSGSEEVVSAGDKQIVEKVIEQVKKIVADKEASVVETVEVAKDRHGALIGTGGSVRHKLEEDYGVTISIPRASDSLTEIKLTGLPEKIEKLKEKIAEMTKDDWNEVVEVPSSLHSLVSEKAAIFKTFKSDYKVDVTHGNLTRKASKLTNGYIPAPPEGAVAEDGDDSAFKFTTALLEKPEGEDVVIPWRLQGEKDATAKVAEIVQERLEKAKAATHGGWFYLKDPKNKVPRLLGPQGRNIKEIRKNTGAFITVPRANDKHNGFVYVVGTEESLLAVEKALSQLV